MIIIYVRNPHPFSYDEYREIDTAISHVAGVGASYVREFPIDKLLVDGGTKTSHKIAAACLKAFHLQARELSKKYSPHIGPIGPVEVVICSDGETPEWARSA
jgi:hypothetical protein